VLAVAVASAAFSAAVGVRVCVVDDEEDVQPAMALAVNSAPARRAWRRVEFIRSATSPPA
jgi:hypothetical protein